MTTKAAPPYPASLTIDYPDRELDRVSTFFRIFYAIPIAIVLASIGGTNSGSWSDNSEFAFGTATGILVLPVLLLIVFREKYPRWWSDFNLQLARLGTRVLAYLALMSDQYPSTDEGQYVHLDLT